jgi:hypothetical protein
MTIENQIAVHHRDFVILGHRHFFVVKALCLTDVTSRHCSHVTSASHDDRAADHSSILLHPQLMPLVVVVCGLWWYVR